jgi:HK97 gp10 family phage protein
MIGATITVQLNRFPEIASRFNPEVTNIINKGVFDLVAAADPITPVDTGTLKGSKQIDTAGGGGDVSAKVTWTAEYAWYVEGGTSRMAAQPFAGPAADRVFPGVIAELSALVERL